MPGAGAKPPLLWSGSGDIGARAHDVSVQVSKVSKVSSLSWEAMGGVYPFVVGVEPLHGLVIGKGLVSTS